MAFKLFQEKGCPLDLQQFTWKELVGQPISKLNDDAFTRIRILMMTSLENEATRFAHSFLRMAPRDLQLELSRLLSIEQHQATLLHTLLPADQSPLETAIAYTQASIEITAAIAQAEPNPYLAQVYRFGLLEDFDHLYRFSALLDRLEGKDPNVLLQSCTDICPGRPTSEQHRSPEDVLKTYYDKKTASTLTKFHGLIATSMKYQIRNFQMNLLPLLADPVARQLIAEITSIVEQHITLYESICDPTESLMEKWLLHEAAEVYGYFSCAQSENNSRIKLIWERFLNYEIEHFNFVSQIFREYENRDPLEVLSDSLPPPLAFESQRDFIQSVLIKETHLRTSGPQFVSKEYEGENSILTQRQLNFDGSPSEIVAAGYQWRPGTELLALYRRKSYKQHLLKGAA